MIITHLKGGLGNQLFQYAAGLSLATHHGVECKVAITELLKPDEAIGTIRQFDLQNIIAAPQIATAAEIKALEPSSFFDAYWQKCLPPFKRKMYKEVDFTFDPNFYKARNHLLLKGYRQSPKYFSNINHQIKDGFVFKQEVIKNVIDLGNQIQQKESVSIHIRRGDYNNAVVREYHGILDDAYYQSAIHHLQIMYPTSVFYIFSDNPDWVSSNLQLPNDAIFVSGSLTSTAFEDFYLISCCRHNIIANSTFSWWAAYLNSNPNKTVIAPKHWFNKAPYNTKDLYPDGWIKL